MGDWFKEVEKGLSLAADAGVAALRTNAASIGQQMASRHEAAIEAIQSLANKRDNDIQERGNQIFSWWENEKSLLQQLGSRTQNQIGQKVKEEIKKTRNQVVGKNQG